MSQSAQGHVETFKIVDSSIFENIISDAIKL